MMSLPGAAQWNFKKQLLLTLGCFTALNTIFCGTPVLADYQNPALERGRQRMSHGDFDGAINALGEALGLDDKDARAYLLRGECFFKMGNYKLAIQDLNNAIQYAPNNVRAYLVRGSCHANLGEDDSAIADYEGAIKLNPNLGRNYFKNGGDRTPVSGNGPAANNNNGNTGGDGNGQRRRGRLINRNGQTTIVEERESGNGAGLNLHAIKDYKQAMSLVYPDGFTGPVGGNTGSNGNAPDRDDTQTNNSPATHVTGPGVGGGLAPVQTDAQNNAGIEQDTGIRHKKRFVSTLDQDPNRGVFGTIPGAGEFQGNAKQAVIDFTENIRTNPNDPATYYQRAKALQKLGRVDDALKDYDQAIERDPQKSQYYIGRASVFYQLGKTLLSEAEINRARAVDPDVPGVVHFSLPKYPASVKWSGGDGPGGH